MKFIVYKTTCLVNGKIYVGVHQTEDPTVFDGYIGDGIATYYTYYIRHPKWAFHYAVAKHGIENFVREVLFVFDTEREAYKKEEEIVNLEFINREDTYNIALGGEYIKKISAPIYQFDFNGNFIERFDSACAAAKKFGTADTTIRESAREKVARCGYLWSWETSVNPEEYYIKSYKKYYIYDSEGFFVAEFDRAAACLEFLEANIYDRGALGRAVKGNYRINGYFVSDQKYDALRIQVTKLNGQLNRYTLDGHYIDSFSSANEAKEKLGLKLASLSSAIRMNRQCNGYRWTRNDNPPTTINVPNK